jgi:hypothetical protein
MDCVAHACAGGSGFDGVPPAALDTGWCHAEEFKKMWAPTID